MDGEVDVVQQDFVSTSYVNAIIESDDVDADARARRRALFALSSGVHAWMASALLRLVWRKTIEFSAAWISPNVVSSAAASKFCSSTLGVPLLTSLLLRGVKWVQTRHWVQDLTLVPMFGPSLFEEAMRLHLCSRFLARSCSAQPRSTHRLTHNVQESCF